MLARLGLIRTMSNVAGIIIIIIVMTLMLCALFVQLLADSYLSLRVCDPDRVETVFLERFPETQLSKHEASQYVSDFGLRQGETGIQMRTRQRPHTHKATLIQFVRSKNTKEKNEG